MAAADPRIEALHALLGALGTLDFARVGELIADDAVFEFPYGSGGPVQGRAAILSFLGASMAAFVSQMSFTVEAAYPAEDPELLVAEYVSVGVLRQGGAYANRYIALLRVRDGRVSHFKEFYNPAAIAAVR